MIESDQFLLQSLLESAELTREQASEVVEAIARTGTIIDDVLDRRGLMTTKRVAATRAQVCEYPFVDLRAFDVDIANARRLDQAVAERHSIFPLFINNSIATLGMANPLDLPAVDHAQRALGCEVDPVVCEPGLLRSLIARAYSLTATDASTIEYVTDEQDGSDLSQEPIVVALNQIIETAIRLEASDIHLNPDQDVLHLRYRIDGVLETQQAPDLSSHAALVQRIKVLAKLDLTMVREPQDGKFTFQAGTDRRDIRVSTVPTVCGENVVMRLLRPSSQFRGIDALEMPLNLAESFERSIQQPHGLVLVTGPTGSGKTTTLYAALSELNDASRNIVTIEDPVEIRMPLVRQIQVNNQSNLTFASALRSVLRQDPDVVLLGEIRDSETARIGIQAALTGHLVFATLHTNDAVGAVARLHDLDAPHFAIASSLLAAESQRLVRRICANCAEPVEATSELDSVVRPGGCATCRGSGFRGRIGIYELLSVSPGVRDAIEQQASRRELIEAAQSSTGSYFPIRDDAIAKLQAGQTTADEIERLIALQSFGASERDGRSR